MCVRIPIIGGMVNMLKKIIGMFLVLFCFCILNVYAACDYETQNDLRVKASHVVANSSVQDIATGKVTESPWLNENGERDLIEEEIPTSICTIYNLTEDLYLTVQNLNTLELQTYYYQDTEDGMISWESTDLTQIIPYEIKVYSNHQDCQNEELYKTQIISAKMNQHSLMSYCYGLETYYCQKYITEEINVTEDKIKEMAYTEQAKLQDKKKNEDKKEEISFWVKYKYVLFAFVGIIILVGLLVFIIKRKQRSDIL